MNVSAGATYTDQRSGAGLLALYSSALLEHLLWLHCSMLYMIGLYVYSMPGTMLQAVESGAGVL